MQSTEDVVALVQRGDPIANQAVRRAGGYLGEVLSANVNFFNPDAIYLGGLLSTLEPFVAAVRSQLYESCHPLMTQHLSIERTILGADAGLVGAGLQGLAQALATTLESIGGGQRHDPNGRPVPDSRVLNDPAPHRHRRPRHRVDHVLPGPHRRCGLSPPARRGDPGALFGFLGDGTPLRAAADWRPTLVGKALPGGLVTAAAFAALSDEIIERLAALPRLDGLWFDIHGAMTVEGIDDAEAVLLQRIRETVGADVLDLDHHGPARQRQPRTRPPQRPDHLLPDGAARGSPGHQGARRPQPRRTAGVGRAPAAQGVGAGAGAAAR